MCRYRKWMIHDFEGDEDYPQIGIDSIKKKQVDMEFGYRKNKEDGEDL